MENDQIVPKLDAGYRGSRPSSQGMTWRCDDSGDALAPPVIQDANVALVVEIEFWEIIGRFVGPAVIPVPEDESRVSAVAQVLDHHLSMIIYSLCSTLAIRCDHDTMLHHIIFLVVPFVLYLLPHLPHHYDSRSTRKHHLGLATPRPLLAAVKDWLDNACGAR
jgi:hypothetical protein